MAIGANLTKRDQTLVAICVMALALGGAYGYFLYMPKRAQLAKIEEHVTTLDAKNEAARRDLSTGSVAKLSQQAAEFKKSLDVLKELVPTTNEVPGLLESVSTAARRVGLDLASVEPMPVIEGEMFDTYRYKLSVKGGYHDIAGFLTNIGSLARIVAPVAVDVKTSDGRNRRGVDADPDLFTAFQIQTYIARPVTRDAEAAQEAGE